jgi:5-hydroxyisourate hydrolase
MGKLTTHVLDTARGVPAEGMRIVLFQVRNETFFPVGEFFTNAQGRTDTPLLDGSVMEPGDYQIEFHVAPYFRGHGMTLPDPPFLDIVPLRIGIADASSNYHVPLLCSPWSYSTYRGS